MPAVAACIIARNEAVHLGNCLSSLLGQVDEIVVVDTGSEDETISIAERFGCKVSRLQWRNDFSHARNFALDQAGTDWILYIDADECLSCGTEGGLKDALPGSGAAAAKVKFYPRLDTTPYAEYRLFRRDPRIRFVGSMHESIVPGIQQACTEDGLVVDELYDVLIRHYGYEGDQSAKHARNLPLLEQAIRENPDRVYLRFHLGAILTETGQPEAASQHLATGMDLAARAIASPQMRVEGSMCAQMLGAVKLLAREPDAALDATQRGLTLFPDNLALLWTKARCLLALGRESEAAAILRQLLEHDPETFFDPRIAYQKSMLGVESIGLLGNALFRLREYGQAAECFDRAVALGGSRAEFATKAALARARAKGSAQRTTA